MNLVESEAISSSNLNAHANAGKTGCCLPTQAFKAPKPVIAPSIGKTASPFRAPTLLVHTRG